MKLHSFSFTLLFICWIQGLDFCNDGEFQCTEPREKCIPTIWMCDGRNDCPDGSDEHAMVCHQHSAVGSGCFGDQPECVYLGVTRCIMHEWLCDGRTDCDNNIDESNCTHVNVTNPGEKPLLSPINLPSRMQPGVSLSEVIRKNQIMQGNTPENPSTSPGCHPFEFQWVIPFTLARNSFVLLRCKSGECIIRDLLCDDSKDCPDGSDESEEKCATPPGLPVVEPPHNLPDNPENQEFTTTETNSIPNALLLPIDNSINQPSPISVDTKIPNQPTSQEANNGFGEIPSPEIATEFSESNILTTVTPIETNEIPTTSSINEERTVENLPDPLIPVTVGPPPPPVGLVPMAITEQPLQPIEVINANLPAMTTISPELSGLNPPTPTLGMPAIIPLRGLLGIPLPTKIGENEPKSDPIMPYIVMGQDGDKRDRVVMNEIPSTSSGLPFSVTNVLPDESFGHSAIQSPLSVDLVDETGVTTKIFVDDNLIPIIPINAPKNYKIMVPIHATIKKKVKIYTSNRLAQLTSTSAGEDEDAKRSSIREGFNDF